MRNDDPSKHFAAVVISRLADDALQPVTFYLYGFGVDDPIPRIPVPLAGEDSVVVGLGRVYDTTFVTGRSFGLRRVDYAELPANFERYSNDDQASIRARLEQIIERLSG